MPDVLEAPSSTPAQSRVLATVELLELVLLFLDPINLFAIQRVCTQWKGLIADSHHLQEHMFLRTPACKKKKSNPEHQSSTARPTAETTLVNHNAETQYYCDDDNDDIDPSSITFSPILTPANQYINTQPHQLALACTQTALLSGHPSWHNMYLSFPACKSMTATLWWTLGDSMRGSVYLGSLAGGSSADGGLRFKDVVEAALALRTGKWKRLPDGKVLPLSAAGRDVCLRRFLEGAIREEGDEVEATGLFVLSF